LEAFAEGTPAGVAAWLAIAAGSVERGADEAAAVCEALAETSS
jgi:hypothetical protein